MMKYAVIIDEGETSFGASVPVLPGCVTTGKSKKETLQLIKEAIEFHIEGLKVVGKSTPDPQYDIAQVDVM